MTIRLPARKGDPLDWGLPLKEASALKERGEKIVWEFDLGLSDPYFPLDDELTFRALCLGLQLFHKEVWPTFQEASDRAILYRGFFDFSLFFRWSERQEENFAEWREGRGLFREEHMRRLFAADAFVAYFQLLAHELPDELPLALEFTGEWTGSEAEKLHLLSLERFEHFLIPREGRENPVALCFPSDLSCSQEVLEKVEALLQKLPRPHRTIPEPFLAQEWEGVDQLYVFPETLTPPGKRMLQGFTSAGGKVLFVE